MNGTGLLWMGRLRLVNIVLIDIFALAQNFKSHDNESKTVRKGTASEMGPEPAPASEMISLIMINLIVLE